MLDGADQYHKLLAVVLRGKDYSVFSASDRSFAELIMNQNTIDLIVENVVKNACLVSEELIQNGLGQSKMMPRLPGSPSVLDQDSCKRTGAG